MRVIETIKHSCRVVIFRFTVSLGIRIDQLTPLELDYATEKITSVISDGFIINRMHKYPVNTFKKRKSNYGKRTKFRTQID